MNENMDFRRDILGSHTVVARIHCLGCDELVCRYGDFWFMIDADYEGNWQQITEEEAKQAIAKFAV